MGFMQLSLTLELGRSQQWYEAEAETKGSPSCYTVHEGFRPLTYKSYCSCVDPEGQDASVFG